MSTSDPATTPRPTSTSNTLTSSRTSDEDDDDDKSLLSEDMIAAAADLNVFDARGNRIRFGALFELERTIVVFIRHFFCGSCQEYVSQLCKVRSEALEQAGTKIVIIGCGDWLLINNYREITSSSSSPNEFISFYADPTRTLYRALGLTTESLAAAPKNAKKPGYIKMGAFENAARSILRALRNPLHLGKQGNISQLGGEFVLGPNNTCSYGHHMRHTQDHAEVADVLRQAGVAFP